MSAFWKLSKDGYTGHGFFEYSNAEEERGKATGAHSGQLDLNTDHDL